MPSRYIAALAGPVFFTFAAGYAGGAFAADLPAPPPPQYLPAWSWAGFYGGIHSAATLGETTFSNPYGPSIFGGRAPTPGLGFGGQIGYNWQTGNWVYGLATDATLLSSSGSTTCAAISGFFTSSNCGADPKIVGTVTGRLGLALGPSGHTLVYAKGGFAWQHGDVSASRNNNPFLLTTRPAVTNSTSRTEPGWTVGAGVEQSLTPAWSVVLEYDFLDFGRQGSVLIPASVFVPAEEPVEPIAANSNVSSNIHMFKLGLNYKFGQDPWASGWGTTVPVIGKAPPVAFAPGWELEGGGRYWYSWGRFQRDVGVGQGRGRSLVSRLTYDNMTANTGEFFGRIDTPVNIFLKGFVGGGSISGGHLNDEDWNPPTFTDLLLYSNASSGKVTGPLAYGTIDLGYNLLRGPGYKAGAFVGYNRYDDTMNAGGCVQIANPFGPCAADDVHPTSQTIISEKDTWDSLRVGAAAEMTLADRWKLSGDLAYVPYTKFTGVDHHLLFVPTEIFDESGHGHGVQAEAFLSYLVTDQFSVGVGGRYWAMWTTSASEMVVGSASRNDTTFRTDRLGVTLQASYKFDVPR